MLGKIFPIAFVSITNITNQNYGGLF